MAEQCIPGFITANGFCVPDIIFEQSFLEKLFRKQKKNMGTESCCSSRNRKIR